MQTHDFKTDCQLTTAQGETLSAFVHLIEVRYSDRIVFWNAVLQITHDQVAKIGDVAGVVMLRLPDGRDAGMHVTHGHSTSEYFELAGVGTPNTRAPAPGPKSKEPDGLLVGNKSILTFDLIAESVNLGPQGARRGN